MQIGEGQYKVKGVHLNLDELDYSSLGEFENLLDKLSDIEPLNSYITDYYQNRLLFMSEAFCRFCGYSKEEVDEMGEGFYRKIFPPEDLPVHIRIAGVLMDAFNSLSMEDKAHAAAIYHFPFYRKDGRKIVVYRRMAPLKYMEDGRLWLSISCLNYSSSNDSHSKTIKEALDSLVTHYIILFPIFYTRRVTLRGGWISFWKRLSPLSSQRERHFPSFISA